MCRCVNVMIAAPIAELRRVDPALHAIVHGERFAADADRLRFRHALRPVRAHDLVVAGRQLNAFARLTIDLRLEEEVGSLTFRLRGIHAALSLSNLKAAHARRPIGIDDLKRHLRRWNRANRDVRAAAGSVFSSRVFETDPLDAKLSLALKRIDAHAAQVACDRKFNGLFLISARVKLEVHLPLAIRL